MEKIELLLKKADLKYTKQREGILSVLLQNEKQLRAEDIYLALQNNGKEYSLSTIYRNLISLEQAGIVEKTDIPSHNGQFFHLKTEKHLHQLICISCKDTYPIDECPLEPYLHEIGQKQGFQVLGHSFEIFGLCPHCQQKNSERELAHEKK